MEGLNYEFRCHHPHEDFHRLVASLSSFLFKDSDRCDERDPVDCHSFAAGDQSPRGAATYTLQYSDEILDRAYELSHQVTVFSDAPFLFAPSHLALAILAFSFDGVDEGGRLNGALKDYLRTSLPEQPEHDIEKIDEAVSTILECTYLDLTPSDSNRGEKVTQRAESLRLVLGKVANLRFLEEMRRHEESTIAARTHRKRYREFEWYYTPQYNAEHQQRRPRVSRVTPTAGFYF